MTHEEIQQEINKLDNLKQLCDETETKISSEQDNETLLNLLEEEYKLTQKSKKEILKLTEGRKKGKIVTKAEENRLNDILFGHCMIIGINHKDKESGEFIGFEMLKNKIAQKKSQLGRKLETAQA